MENRSKRLKTEQHGASAEREGGRGFINTTERLREDLPFLVLKTKEIKKRRQN